jgi:hypothetical protein
MPSYLNVYNATLEPLSTQFKSKGYCFEPRRITKLPEEFEFALPQYFKNGLVVINAGDDLKSKEKEALLNYLAYLMEQRAYLYMYMDEKKRAGVTIDKPRRLLAVEKWIDEIKARYAYDDTFEAPASFKDAPEMDRAALFAGEMQIKSVAEIVREANSKRPKSFTEVDIEEEVRS